MTLITVRPCENESDNENGQFQVPIDDLEMPLSDLYDIIFSLTDISPDQLCLYHNDVLIERKSTNNNSVTLRQIGIVPPAVIKYRKSDDDGVDGIESLETEVESGGDAKNEKVNENDSTTNDKSKSENENSSSATTAITNLNSVNEALNQTLKTCLQSANKQETKQFMARLEMYHSQIIEYDDVTTKNKALSIIPVTKIKNEASCDKESKSYEEALTKSLLKWFKTEYFTWVNNPACWSCNEKKRTKLIQVERASAQEMKNGQATRTEVYICEVCNSIIRFARYENALHLLQNSSKGRCGEWAKAFTLCCIAMGLDARMVHDWTDHVWTEIWIEQQGKYMHADSCEQSFNEPLLYEQGWGKKLTYCVAVGKHAIIDVTKKYSKDIIKEGVCDRRDALSEVGKAKGIYEMNRTIWNRITDNELKEAQRKWRADIRDMSGQGDDGSEKGLGGRQSGSEDWVKARGEDGSPSSSSR